MNDLERRLEELFMSDSGARRVERVNVRVSRRGLPAFAFLGAVSLATLALVAALSLARSGRENVPASTPSDAAAVADRNASASVPSSAAPTSSESVLCGEVSQFTSAPTGGGFFVITPRGQTGSRVVIPDGVQVGGLSGYACVKVRQLPQGAPSIAFVSLLAPGTEGYVAEGSASPSAAGSNAPTSVKPDAAHGLITFTNLRTEADATDLQQPPYFARTTFNTFEAAVSPDGKRVAVLAGGETGTSLIWFTTARPNDVTRVLGFAGSGEVAGPIVWAGDNSPSVLFAAYRQTGASPQAPTTYSALRVVDLGTNQVREIARINNGSRVMPVAWRPDRRFAGAIEVVAGAANTYDVVRDGSPDVERTPLGGAGGAVSASRDGLRIAAIVTAAPEVTPVVRWWPSDQPAAARTIASTQNGRPELASFRPGAPDELGVSIAAPCVACQGVPPPGHFEIWNVATGAQRVVNATVGFQMWRADGSAAIQGATLTRE